MRRTDSKGSCSPLQVLVSLLFLCRYGARRDPPNKMRMVRRSKLMDECVRALKAVRHTIVFP